MAWVHIQVENSSSVKQTKVTSSSMKKILLQHKLEKVEKYQPSSNGVFSSKFPFCIEGCTVKDWTQAKDRANTKKSLKSMLTNL